MPLTLNPAIGAGIAKMFGSQPPPPPAEVGDFQTRRERAAAVFTGLKARRTGVTDVDTKDFYVKASDGHDILLRWYTKKASQPGSAVLYMHGGGMIALTVDLFDELVKPNVSRSGVPYLAVEYRLAPEAKAPTQLTDSFEGLKYLHAHAAELGVDVNRIGVIGESAGGGIAASLAHYAKAQGGPSIAKQILVYPMLDDRNLTMDPHIAPFAFWTADDNKTGWDAMLGDGHEKRTDIPPTHAAGRMTVEDAVGLPPAYMDVGELDLFKDEILEYARKLGKAGVSCEFHLIPSVPHGFELFAPEGDVTRDAVSLRIKALQSF